MSPKSTRNIKLMNTVTEMSKDSLNVLQYPDVVVSTTISIVVLQFVDNLKAIKLSASKSLIMQFHHQLTRLSNSPLKSSFGSVQAPSAPKIPSRIDGTMNSCCSTEFM